MAAANQIAGEFENWLNERLDSLEVDREVYGAYILGVLQEEENDEEQKDALRGILSAFLDEDSLEEVCQQILKQWAECGSRSAVKGTHGKSITQYMERAQRQPKDEKHNCQSVGEEMRDRD
ncbi:coiled-coil domain-containing protein 43-like [Carassius carassius]|uniref:coiled-coil domain-containing protein 43-like n=1 Tax=Carassius carassius TaxID=217509 RepID=UPI002868D068|nr:coiled-coil domain-containing protein 43-like [Carassius carassius]